MKRLTYWPQLFLGITFNYGLILGWVSVKNQIDIVPITLYLGAIFWTLAYDTIYGFQDIKDDEIIGLKSTSIKFKNNPKKFIFICFSLLIFSILMSGYLMNFNFLFYLSSVLLMYHLFFFQLKNINFQDTKSCLETFKSNNMFGLLVLFNIFIGKF